MYFYRTYRDERERVQGKATRAPSTYTTLGRKGGEARAGGGARGCVPRTWESGSRWEVREASCRVPDCRRPTAQARWGRRPAGRR